MGNSHRLAVIVMMDVVGFTSLVERDEAATLRRWSDLLINCVEPAVALNQGDIFRRLGDGMLVVFEAAHQALACVLEVQGYFAQQIDTSPLFRLRAAIHAGDVTVWEDDLQGSVVNIAARLQEFAAPGGIVVSSAVEELVRGRFAVTMHDLGYLDLKGIAAGVRAYSLLERPGPLAESRVLGRSAGRRSIAVLPFVDSNAADGNYFGDGIVDEIVNALAAEPDVFVVSRGSTLSFRGEGADPRRVREALGVSYVLSGSVRRAGSRVRITVELCDCESLSVMWSDRIEGQIGDIFDFQDEVARQVVSTIAPQLQKAEITRAVRKRPDNLNAYDCFLRGLDLVYRLDRELFYQAKVMFARAIELDPAYGAPHAYSALWHAIRVGQGWSPNIEVDQKAVVQHANAALERDRLDASSLALIGHVRSILLRDYQGAFTLFDRAVAAGPNSAIAWVRSSPTYSYVGDWKEGRRRAEVGLRLSPLDRHVFYTYTALALAAYTGAQYDEAIDWSRKAMSENRGFTANLRLLIAALAADGQVDEARQVGGELVVLEPDFNVARFSAGYAYKSPERRDSLAAHLRAAGLPG